MEMSQTRPKIKVIVKPVSSSRVNTIVLEPYQQEHKERIRKILKENTIAIDLSMLGLGKT